MEKLNKKDNKRCMMRPTNHDMERLISVIIPIYITAAYIGRCLDSVINNSYKNLEIICVNDGSTDKSLSVLQSYTNRDKRIHIISIPNSGVSVARNTGLDFASGEFIAFIDSDDWIHKEYFKTLIDYQRKEDLDVVACKFTETSEYYIDSRLPANISIISYNVSESLKNKYLKYYIWGRIYRRSILESVRFPVSISIGEDNIFNFLLFYTNQI